jgi:putative transferase (TIGR04331 family)
VSSPGRRLLVTTTLLDEVPATASLVVTSEHIEMVARRKRPGRSVVVMPTEPSGREAFEAAASFERARYERYVPILAQRLNNIHGLNRDEAFWDRVTGMTLLMHVSACRRVFAMGQLARREGLTFSTVAESAFRTPADEAQHRQYHQYSELGDEQLFAILSRSGSCGDFVPGADSSQPSSLPRASEGLVSRTLRRARSFARRTIADPFWLGREAGAKAMTRTGKPAVLVTQCFWSYQSRQRVQLRSRGRVVVDDTAISFPRAAVDAASAARAEISAPPADGDDFDRFFLASLRWSAPASWLEDFRARLTATRLLLDARPSLRVIVNETVDESTCLLLAEAKERGVELLHCEHNYLQHQFVGNMIWFHLRKFDKYLSLGWSSDRSSRIVPAGSCFAWTEPPRTRRDVELLFIASVSIVRAPVISAGYGEAGSANAASYWEMTRDFLGTLGDRTLSRMYYRDYPIERRAALFEHPVEATLLDGFRERIGTLERTGAENTTSLIARARLTVVNYLSTAYNQALLAGTPTIVLFNTAAYHLTDDARGIYDELIRAGIFQTDPVRAAALVESIVDDPQAWWERPDVQSARAAYLRANFGSADALERYVVNVARARSAA